MRRVFIYLFLFGALICAARPGRAQDAEGASLEADGTPNDGSDSSWDFDFDDPFSVTDAIYGFPHIPMFGLSSVKFVIPSVANNTASDIVVQVYLSRFINPVNGHNNMANTTYMAISGCTFTVKKGFSGSLSPPPCVVSPADNAQLTSLGIVNTQQEQQNIGLGFGKLAGSPSGVPYPAMGLTFSGGNQVSLTLGIMTVGSCGVVNYEGVGGTQFSSQCGVDVGPPGQTVTATPSTTDGDNWLTVTADSTTEPATLTLSANSANLSAAIYTGSVLVTSASGSATVTVVLGVFPTVTQFIQQGPKLMGNDAVGSPNQGYSVALSSDGNTMMVGGLYDNNLTGATWVYTRSSGLWSQQGSKLVASSTGRQGYSVGLSADGNTAITGVPADGQGVGAAWIYTRASGVWTQGPKLVGTNAIGQSSEGLAVAMSGDGNTAIIGGSIDNNLAGAAWVFTRSGGNWTQQTKLAGTSAGTRLGTSVALSADGNTAAVGGNGDASNAGAVWVYTRSSGVWTQQGNKLTGASAIGAASQGGSVALSSDGNTLIEGGPGDNNNVGAAWVFTRSGTSWSQQAKLIGGNAVGASVQGGRVALSADGKTAVIGGGDDNSNTGADWVFMRSGSTWSQFGSKLIGSNAAGAAQQTAAAISGDGSTIAAGGTGDSSGVGATWLFVLSGGLPTITSTSPPAVTAGGPAFTLTVNGSNFRAGAIVSWNGTPLTSTLVNANQMTALVPANLIVAATTTITVSNDDGSSANFAMAVNPALTLTTTSLPSGTVGVPYSATINSSGGTPPYGWSLTNQLPPGLTYTQQQGSISITGTPTTVATYMFTYTVTDNSGATASNTYSIAIASTTGIAVSGQVSLASSGVGMSGVTITVTGSQTTSTITNASGGYSVSLAQGGTYTLSASLSRYSFNGPFTFTNLIANQTANFTGTLVTNNCIGMLSSATNLTCSAMSQGAFQGNLAVSIGAQTNYFGAMTLVGNAPFSDAAGMALYNAGGGGGASVSLDLYNTSFNGGIPQAKIKAIDDGNYSDHLTFWTKTPGGPNNAVTEKLRITSIGNVGIGTTNPILGPLQTGSGAFVSAGGVWTNASDRNLKENFVPVLPDTILRKIDSLPLTEWNYKNEDPTVRHIGPVAQDFFSIFGVGNSSTSISTIDPSGIALAGIQGLYQKTQARAIRLAELKKLAAKTEELRSLEERLARLESLLERTAAQK